MGFGIADLSIVPVRREQSERSEMVSQVLFGELFEVLEVAEKWVYIRLVHDGYEGWIDRKMYMRQIIRQKNLCWRPKYLIL